MLRGPSFRSVLALSLVLAGTGAWAADSVCYRASAKRADQVRDLPPTAVQDRFGVRSVLPGAPASVCREVGGEDEDVLAVVRNARTDGGRKAARVGEAEDLVTRFGSEHLAVKRVGHVQVDGLVGGTPPGAAGSSTCYLVKGRRKSRGIVVLSDALGEHVLRVGKPKRLCIAPGAADRVCYSVKPVRGSAVDGGGETAVTTAYGTELLRVRKVAELCVDAGEAPPPPPETDFFLRVTPSAVTITAGESVILEGRAFFDAGGSEDWSDRLVWTSSDEQIATVRGSAGGAIVDGLGPGTVTIRAEDAASGVTSGDSNGDASVTVVWDLRKLTMDPPAVRKPIGGREDYTVIGHFGDGTMLNLTQRVIYMTSNPSVVSTPNEPGRKSRVHALAPGVARISARDPISNLTTTQFGNDATLRVAGGIPYIQLDPARGGRLVLDVGTFYQLTAVALTPDGISKNVTQDCEWSSSDPSIVAYAPMGLQGSRFEAVSTGTATVTCVDPTSGQVGTSDVDVVTGELVELSLFVGRSRALGDGFLVNGTTIGTFAPFGGDTFPWRGSRNVTQDVEYVSRAPDVVAAPNTPGNRSAFVTGTIAGTTQIYAVDSTSGVQSNDVGVHNPGALTGLSLSWPPWRSNTELLIRKGAITGPISVRAIYEQGVFNLTRFEPDAFVLESADASIVAVDELHRLIGIDGGVTTVTARHLEKGFVSNPLTVTVKGDIVSLTISPTSVRRAIGEFEDYTVRGVFEPDIEELIRGPLELESSDTSVAQVVPGESLRIRTVGAGTATIVAFDPATGVRSPGATVEVLPGTIERVTIAPVTRTVARGDRIAFTATGHYEDGRTINVTQTSTWAVQDPSVAQTTGRPRIITSGPGTTRVIATHSSGVSSTDSGDDATLVVEELASIELRPAVRTASAGTSIRYTVVGIFTDGGEINLTQDASYWTSDSSLAVALNDEGDASRIDLVGPGDVTVNAYVFGRSTQATLTIE